MERDWLIDVAGHLKGQSLRRKMWTRWSERWDHDHCTVCGAKFAEFEGADIQKEGYATTESYTRGTDYEWVCLECFSKFKDKLNWSEVL